MRTYLVVRIGQLVPTLLGVSVVVFLMLRLIPGDPVDLLYHWELQSPEAAQALRRQLGLDRPVAVQYVDWLRHVARGDLGYSLDSGRAVLPEIVRRMLPTIELTTAAVTLSAILAIPLGVVTAVYRDSVVDLGGTVLSFVGLTLPNFALGSLLVFVLSIKLRWLPSAGYAPFASEPLEHVRALLLPTITLAAALVGSVTRMTRSSMLEVMTAEYLRTGRSKGLSERTIIMHHALKNALIPVVTVLGIQCGRLLGGVIVVEYLFAWPGIGGLLYRAISVRDYPIVQSVILILTGLFVAINFLIDLLYLYLDPRIRYA